MMYPVVIPFGFEWDLQHYSGDEWLSAAGRLKPGVTFSQADANFAQLTESLKPIWRAEKLNKDNLRGLLIPANESRFPPEKRHTVTTFLAMLMAVVSLILLIACSNVASLMLARAVKRQREIRARLALGARLFQQLLTEGLLLSLAGGAAGLAIALATTRFLAGFRAFGLQLLGTGIDGRVVAVAFGLSVLTGVVFGLMLLRQVSHLEVAPALKTESSRRWHTGTNARVTTRNLRDEAEKNPKGERTGIDLPTVRRACCQKTHRQECPCHRCSIHHDGTWGPQAGAIEQSLGCVAHTGLGPSYLNGISILRDPLVVQPPELGRVIPVSHRNPQPRLGDGKDNAFHIQSGGVVNGDLHRSVRVVGAVVTSSHKFMRIRFSYKY
ncbi:MAG: hypothetical protein LAQ69_11615 [Acidobacteriia bacterium]|nr:hypothetical protein [Terriglobia bacterium]